MNNELLNVLRSANREFQEFMDEVSQIGGKTLETRGAAQRLEKVDRRLKQISYCLSALSRAAAQDPEAAGEVRKYRENLKALRPVMEKLQFSLRTEKARLERVRTNMQAARAWAASLREIS
jgi:chromosome segregation ATPase